MFTRIQPLADQVRKQILQWIQSNRIDASGGTLPSETEMAEMFATSRATVREALAQLERSRLVIRRQGSGTYLSPAFHKLTRIINELSDPLNIIDQQGSAGVGRMDRSLVPAGVEAAGALEIDPQDLTVHLSIQYLSGGSPAACLEAVIPVYGLPADGSRLPPFSGLLRFAYEVSGRPPTYAITTLRAIAAVEPVAGLLEVPAGHPLMEMNELYLTDSGRPAFQARLSLLSTKVDLELLRNSDQSAEQVVIW